MAQKAQHFEAMVLNSLSSISVWGAGRDGKKFFMCLSRDGKAKVRAEKYSSLLALTFVTEMHQVQSFCDVDDNKIGRPYMDHVARRHIPIISYEDVTPPVAIWFVLGRRQGREG